MPDNIFKDVKPKQNIFATVPKGNIFANVGTPKKQEEDKSFLGGAYDVAKKVAGYGLEAFDLLTRPWNAIVGAGMEGAKADKASTAKYGSAWAPAALKEEAQAVGKGFVRGIKGEQNYPLSGMIRELAPGVKNVHPLAWLVDSKNDMWAPRTPEQEAAYAVLRQEYAKKHPVIASAAEGAKKAITDADIADVLGIIGDFRGSLNVLPSIGGKKIVETTKIAAGSGKTAKLAQEATRLKAYEQAGEAAALLPAQTTSFVAGEHAVPVVRRFRLSDPTQRLSNLFGQVGQEATDIYNAARVAPVAGRKELVEYVYKGLGGETSGIAKREVQRLDLGRLQELAQSIAETGPRPTMEQIVAKLAEQRGVNLEKLLQDVSTPPTLRNALLQAAERSRLARAAGVSEAPPGVKRLLQKVEGVKPVDVGLTQAETVSEGASPTLKAILARNKDRANPKNVGLSRKGLGLKTVTGYKEAPKGIEWFGKELVAGDKYQKAIQTVSAPIRNTAAYQAFNRALNRIPASAPAKFKDFVWQFDKRRNVANANADRFARETGKALAGLSDEEQRLVTHAIDQGKDLSKRSDVVHLIADAGLKLKSSELDLNKLKQAQDYAQKWLSPEGGFATEEVKRGLLKNVKENYVTYLFDRSNPKTQALLSQTAKRGAKLSENHPFQTREFWGTLADAKRAGIPIQTERIGDILAVRGHAHFRSVANHDTLETIKGMRDLVTKSRNAPKDWVEGGSIAPQLKGYYVHPDVKRFLEAELSTIEANTRGFIHSFYDVPMSVWKTLVTRINLGFHGRNAIDNAFKNFLADVDQRFASDALAVRRGGAGTFVTKTGQKIPYATIRRWIDEYGLTGTGWFGRAEDVQNAIQRVINESRQSKIGKILNTINPGQLGMKLGNEVETNAKLTHFLDRLYKYGDPDLAAQSVNRFLFNYSDLTSFEREYLRRIAPFYTFRRKNIPLMYQQLLENPGKFAQLQVAKQTVEGSNRPQDDEVPDYMKEQFSVALGKQGGKQGLLLPGFSTSDLQVPLRPLSEGYSMLTPALRLPIELYHNKTWYGGDIDRYGGFQTKELPGYLNWLASEPRIREVLGIKQIRNAKGETEYRIPAKARYVLDALAGSAPRDIGKMFERGTPADFVPTLSSFIKWVDTEKERQYKVRAEREARQNKKLAERDERRRK